MTNTELQIKGLLTELQARTDQMSVTVAKVEGLERELAAAQKNSDLAQAETYGQFDRARRAEADRDRLREVLKEIGNVLGPGTCAACQCEGCAWEAKEAVRLAISALAHTVTHSHSQVPEVGNMVEHPDTVKHCCGESGFGREWPGEQRDVCPACAKRAEQWEREALEKALVRVIEEAERG